MGEEGFEFSVGPVHPALKEPVRVKCEVEGEKVKDADFELSQVHRGIEWAGTKRNPVQILYLSERICGICNICHTLAFSRAVENIAGIETPKRAEYIRTLTAELERIHSHILWAGVAANELGFDSVMQYTWKAREKILDVIEHLTGNRITKAMITIGGARRDVTKEREEKIRGGVEYYRKAYDKLENIVLQDKTIKARTRGIGVLTEEEAIETCAVGPTARASGVGKDVRKTEEYGAYQDLDIEPITPDMYHGEVNGDVYDRIACRVLEIKQSLDIIEDCLDMMPGGDIKYEENIPKLLSEVQGAEGEGIGRHEAPRGEVIHHVKLVGEETPKSWRVRAPTYNNLLSWIPMLKDEQIADIPIIAASIDPCMSCANRAVVKDGTTLEKERLRELSRKKTKELKEELGDA